jgi:LPS export ABC transporter protein LptC
MNIRNFSFFLLFLIASGSLFFQLKYFQAPDLILVSENNYPDAYVENLLAVQMSKEGLPEQQLTSIHALHYPKNNSIFLKKPFVTLYQINSPAWELRALSSIIYPDLNKIDLEGDVYAHQPAGTKNVETTLVTTQASIYTKTKIVTTNQIVTLLRPGVRVQSEGARANMAKGEVILSSNAQVYYNAKQAKAAAT